MYKKIKYFLAILMMLTSFYSKAETHFSASESGNDTHILGSAIPFAVTGFLDTSFNKRYHDIHFLPPRKGKYRISNYFERQSGDYDHLIRTSVIDAGHSDLDFDCNEIEGFGSRLSGGDSAYDYVDVNLEQKFYRVRVQIQLGEFPNFQYTKKATYIYQIKVLPCTIYYNVNFNANGGSQPLITRSVENGNSIGTLPTPTRSGYAFDGWYTSASGGTKITESQIITGNVTYYAHWIAVPMSIVTFDANGGSVSPTTRSVEKGSAIGTLPVPTRTGYTFVGWYTTPSMKTSTIQIKANTIISENMTCYAYWEKIVDMTVSTTVLSISATGECEDIVVTANCEWIVNTSLPWVKVSTEYGSGNGIISIIADRNVSNMSRSGKITIGSLSGGILYEVNLQQSGVDIDLEIQNGVLKSVNLKEAEIVELPTNITSIGDEVFSYCRSLKCITIPSTVTSIGNYAFEYCNSLTNISIPDSVKSIGYCAFAECSSLKEVLLPKGIECIDFHTFANCRSLENIFIPGRVSSIDASAFTGCMSLRAFDVDWDNKYYIDVDGFLLDSSGETFVASPGSVTNAVIPSGVKKIGEQAFWKNTFLKDVVIPNGVTNIGDSAFAGCDSLVNVTIPATVSSIEYCGFACESLSCVIFKGNAPDTGFRIFATASNCTAYVLHTSSGWGVDIPGVWNEVRIEKYIEGNTIITFDSNGGAISESKRNVEFGAKIGQLPIPVRNGYIFDGWYTAITGGNKISAETVSVGNNTYYAHWRGDNDYTPESMFEYRKLDGLVSITKYKGEDKRVNIPQNIEGLPVMSISLFAFRNCDFIQSVKIPKGVTNIEGFSFDGCSSLASIEIPDSVTNIEAYAFSDCVSLERVTIPNSITKVEGGVFSDCSSMSSITIPKGIKSIGDYAFSGCTSLVRIEFEGNAPIILTNVFFRVADTCTAYVKQSSTGWGVSIPGKWKGLNIAYIDGGTAQTPIPPSPKPTPNPGSGTQPSPELGDVDYGILGDKLSGEVPEDAASVYDGYVYSGNKVVGTIQAKVAKPKNDIAKVTATIQITGEKKVSVKGELNVVSGKLEAYAKDERKLYLMFGLDGMKGSFGAYEIDGARNFFSSKDKAEKADAENVLEPWLGALNMKCPEGVLSVTIAKKGKVTVKGTYNGAKVSAKAQALIGEDMICIPVMYSKKTVNLAFTIWLPIEGTKAEIIELDGAVIGKAGTLVNGAEFDIEGDIKELIPTAIEEINGYEVLPYGESVSVSGKKWVVAGGAKAAKIAYKKGELTITEGKKGQGVANASGLKLTYKSKDGSFTGSFTLYAIEKGKLKKHKATVTGVLIDGIGYGTATIKKVGTWAIEIK